MFSSCYNVFGVARPTQAGFGAPCDHARFALPDVQRPRHQQFRQATPASTSEASNADLSDGWGVDVVVPKPGPRPTRNGEAPRSQKWGASQATEQPERQAVQGKKGKKKKSVDDKKREPRMPFVNMQTDGMQQMGALRDALQETGSPEISTDERRTLRREGNESIRAQKKKGPEGNALTSQITRAAASLKKRNDATDARREKSRNAEYYDDDGRSWAEEEELVDQKPAFSVSFDDEGAVFENFDDEGEEDEDEEDEDEAEDTPNFEEDDGYFDFSDGDSGWGKMDAVAAPRPAGGRRKITAEDMEEEMSGTSAYALSAMEERDHVLEEFAGIKKGSSLMEDMGVVPRRAGSKHESEDELIGMEATWGGTGTSSGMVDFDATEGLLHRIFRPHKVKQLMEYQREAVEQAKQLKAKPMKNPKLKALLRITAGTHANHPIISSMGAETRPMMEKVRQAIFSMIQSQCENVSTLPSEARWLDLFAGTGSVGLEALSRGVAEVHFVEMDPWLCKNVLGRNVRSCSFQRRSVVHTFKAEDFLQKALQLPRFAGGAFDFISMCPPYLLVSYPQLFELLDKSPLLHAGTIMFVEYSKELFREIPDTVGPLVKLRDRKYGRTRVVVYGPADLDEEEEEAYV